MTSFGNRALAAAAGAAGLLVASTAGAVTLNTTTSLTKTHDQSTTYLDLFFKKMNERDNGITMVYKGGPEVIPYRKQGAALKRGLIDVLFGPSTYYAGLVPETRVITLSNVSQAEIRKNGAWDLFETAWNKGLNAHLLAHPFEGGSRFHIYLAVEPKLSDKTGLDLTGLKMRSTAAYKAFFLAMGATPIQISPGDVYTSLQRGLVSGLAWPEGGVARYGWQEFIKYRVGPGFWRSSSVLCINLDKYKSLTQKERDVLDSSALEFEKESGPYLRKLADIDNKKVFAAGVKPMDLTGKPGAAFTRTVYGATWETAKKYKLRVSYDKLRSLLLK